MIESGQATPDKSHQWGSMGLYPSGAVNSDNTKWFAGRANAVTHAKLTYGQRYAIARAWLEGQDASAHRGGG